MEPPATPGASRPPTPSAAEVPQGTDNDGPIVVANEFADVVVRKAHTRNGVRLEIWSPRRGTVIHLDAVALDCLSYQEPELITELLARTPGA
ncbi:hypothetical protein [Nocardioides humi]|uniref:Dihydrodiol dehydrogenase n=1 Tax=Nocardioides humi TaxID=449461 RepID=A0ABN2ADY4_9ACTN|nr:hypothetical protein [Nocardioides humi]